MDENTKVKVFVLGIIVLIIGSFYYVQNEQEKEKVKAGDCFRIKNSISISKMEETLEASQANELFNIRYKDLIEKKYGVRYCFQADNVGECERYKREESIRNDRDIRKPFKKRQAQLKQIYEDKQCSAKNRFDTTPTYNY